MLAKQDFKKENESKHFILFFFFEKMEQFAQDGKAF